MGLGRLLAVLLEATVDEVDGQDALVGALAQGGFDLPGASFDYEAGLGNGRAASISGGGDSGGDTGVDTAGDRGRDTGRDTGGGTGGDTGGDTGGGTARTWWIVEADESDRSLLNLSPSWAVVPPACQPLITSAAAASPRPFSTTTRNSAA